MKGKETKGKERKQKKQKERKECEKKIMNKIKIINKLRNKFGIRW